jgi:hypothetical protein
MEFNFDDTEESKELGRAIYTLVQNFRATKIKAAKISPLIQADLAIKVDVLIDEDSKKYQVIVKEV